MDIFRPSLWVPSKRDSWLAPAGERRLIKLPAISPGDDFLKIANEGGSHVSLIFPELGGPNFFVGWTIDAGAFVLLSPHPMADDRTHDMVNCTTVRIYSETECRVVIERGRLGEPVGRAR